MTQDIKNYKLFVHYWTLYREHYGRHLSKLPGDPDDADRYLYRRASESKQTAYAYWNSWLAQRDRHDYGFTVLGGNCQHFTLGAVYAVIVRGTTRAYIYRVVTPTAIHEWYISDNTFATGYIAPVPAHRVDYHTSHSLPDTVTTEQLISEQATSWEDVL